MRDFSYAFISEDNEQNARYYREYLGWESIGESDTCLQIDTDSPMEFSLIDKEYLENVIGISPDCFPEKSFCIWNYDSEAEMLEDEKAFIAQGASKVGVSGHFIQDTLGCIWQLKLKGADL